LAVVEPKTAAALTTATPDSPAPEFAGMVGHVVKQYPFAKTIAPLSWITSIATVSHSLINYYGEQKRADILDRLTVHYTQAR